MSPWESWALIALVFGALVALWLLLVTMLDAWDSTVSQAGEQPQERRQP